MFLGQIKFFLGNRVFIGRSSTYLFGKSVCIVRSRKDFKGKTFSIDNQIYIYWVKLLSLLDQVNIHLGKSVCIARSRKDFRGKTFSIDNQIYIYWVKLLSLLDQVNIYYVNCFGFVWGKLFIGSSCKDLFE